MALTYTVDSKGQADAFSSTITSNTLTVAAGDFITVVVAYDDNDKSTAWTVSNTGDAITWTKQVETNTASNSKVVLWTGTAGTNPPTTVSVLSTAGASVYGSKWMSVMAHSGAHGSNPLPAGNIFSGTGGHNVSQSITPTSVGSALWLAVSDWSQTNSFAAAANCTLGTVYNEAGRQTSVLVRPSTQPRTDAAAFSIGQTDTAGKIAWVAFEVQAAAASPTITTQPASQRIPAGQTAAFSVAATTSGGALSYQWQSNATGSWVNIGGATSSSYTTAALAAGVAYAVRVNVSDSNGTTTSSIVDVWTPAAKPPAWAGLYGRGGGRDVVRGNAVLPTSKASGLIHTQALLGTAVSSGINGQVSGALGAVAGSITATVKVGGAVSGALADVSGSFTGAVRAAGVVSGALADVSGAITAVNRAGGQVTGTLADVSGAITGATRVGGAVSSALADVAGTITAATRVAGQVTGALDPVSGSITATGGGGASINGQVAGALDPVSGSIAAAVRVAGSASGSLADVSGSVTAGVRAAGAVSGLLADVSGSVTATARVAGSVAGVLGNVGGSLTAGVRIGAVVSGLLADVAGAQTAAVSLSGAVAGVLGQVSGAITATSGSPPVANDGSFILLRRRRR